MKPRELVPSQIVEELGRYIIGQDDAKRSVAIAVRNKWRRDKVEGKIKNDILPANIILIGPTGVGKTEIARRLAGLVRAPFVKVEASKFTEVGYVGRDVESMVRDLMNISVSMVRSEKLKVIRKKAEAASEERILDLLLPSSEKDSSESREKLRKMFRAGKLNKRQIELTIEIQTLPVMEVFSPMGFGEIDSSIHQMVSSMLPKQSKKRKASVNEARQILIHQEAQKLIDMDEVVREAKYRAENHGMIFLDEIDKIVGVGERGGPEVSRSGVQRDLLPIVEGSAVMTKHGIINTDYVLFFAAGAFTSSKPSDLIPELQGRFPIRVELKNLSRDDLRTILVKPENALVKQYRALFATEGVALKFAEEAIDEIAHFAAYVNDTTENIGARRLQTVMSTLLEDYLFELPSKKKRITINAKYVKKQLQKVAKDKDLSRYIL
jgi:ATP-dependent HslUV protease ATP-binding subunit HslU